RHFFGPQDFTTGRAEKGNFRRNNHLRAARPRFAAASRGFRGPWNDLDADSAMAEGPVTPDSTADAPEAGDAAADLEQSALFPGAPTVASLSDSDVLASLSAWA